MVACAAALNANLNCQSYAGVTGRCLARKGDTTSCYGEGSDDDTADRRAGAARGGELARPWLVRRTTFLEAGQLAHSGCSTGNAAEWAAQVQASPV